MNEITGIASILKEITYCSLDIFTPEKVIPIERKAKYFLHKKTSSNLSKENKVEFFNFSFLNILKTF